MKYPLVLCLFASLRALLLACLTGLSILSVSGCHQRPPFDPWQAPIPYLTLMTIDTKGVQVVQEGSRLLIVIYTDEFFEPMTAQVMPCRANDLTKVAYYIAQYTNLQPYATVYVRAYTDRFIPVYAQAVLSRQYTEVMTAYLWNAGIDTARIQAAGFGSHFPIASQRTVKGMGHNRRIEIQIN